MAEQSHDHWAKTLMTNDANYHENPNFVPYELLNEVKKEELRGFSLDLLRYMRVAGFEPSKTRPSLMRVVSGPEESNNHQKFSLQFMDRFLEFLSPDRPLGAEFYLKVLFPVMNSYLQKYVAYFMPSTCNQVYCTTSSREEKLKIMTLFLKLMEFTRKNLDMLFPSVKKPSAKVLSPSTLEGEEKQLSDADNSWAASKCIFSLLQSIILSMDIKGLAVDAQAGKNCDAMVDFFRQATSGINLTTKNIAKLDTLDSQFHFYCLQLLIPSLTVLFRHVGLFRVGDLLIKGHVENHCCLIFQNLIEMAIGTAPVYVGSSPLVTIGQCMGAFALAYPHPFLHNTQFGFDLESLLTQLHNATVEGTTGGNVLFVVDIVIPVLASYSVRTWSKLDPLFAVNPCDLHVDTINEIVANIMTLMAQHFGDKSVKWFNRLVESSVLLAGRCSVSVLSTHIVPMMGEMKERCIQLWNQEYHLSTTWNYHIRQDHQRIQAQDELIEYYQMFVKDFASFLPFLTVFLYCNRDNLKQECSHPTPENEGLCKDLQTLFTILSDIFHCWLTSQYFNREFQAYMHQFKHRFKNHIEFLDHFNHNENTQCKRRAPQVKVPPASAKLHSKKQQNAIQQCLDMILPLVERLISQEDRSLVEMCTSKLGMKGVTPEDLKAELIHKFEMRELKQQKLTHKLVRSLSTRFMTDPRERAMRHQENALKILAIAKIKYRAQQAEKGSVAQKRWKKLFTRRKRKAVIKCFLAVPYFKLAKHRAINLFLSIYSRDWLSASEHSTHHLLTRELLDHQDYLAQQRIQENDKKPRHEQKQLSELEQCVDPLSQLFKMLQRLATTGEQIPEQLYISYATVLGKSVVDHNEDEELGTEDDPTGAYEVYTAHKAELVRKQAQLADRGAPTTIINLITASKGVRSPSLNATLLLGIALLNEGNMRIQGEMLQELNTMDVGFLSSISKLISTCSVLDWNAYERFNKAQTSHTEAVCKVLPNFALTISLFRFLQLLCEGHNISFQNYLRTQAGNTTTVNIIVCTVDYLLRLQESISDFFWHYSDHQTIDLQGRENFLKAFKVAKQVFRTLTEYTQGPCVKNQDALAHSRLWDAVSGFIHIFAVLQRKLYKDTSQMELLRELLGLQEEMFILLLAMLEGSTMSSAIGKLMVDMLVESAHYIEDIMSFFSIFVKLKDSATSKAFKEYDLNRDGFISYREFEKAMEAQQRYSKEEIAYLMECADLNHDGLLDYLEFTERFHQPAENIGFHLCVLIVHLTDHLPNDKRVERLKRAPQSRELLDHFERNMGCIEIMGKSGRIERVYFEVKDSRLNQWKETQIKQSRRSFLHSVEMGSQKNKLKGFMSFCDETIFEMNYSDKISGSVQVAMEERAVQHRKKHNRITQLKSQPFVSRVQAKVTALQQKHSYFWKFLTCLQLFFMFLHLNLWPRVCTAAGFVWNRHPVVLAAVKRCFRLLFRLFKPRLPTSAVITNGSPHTAAEDTKTGRINRSRRPPTLKIPQPGQPHQPTRQKRILKTTALSPNMPSATSHQLGTAGGMENGTNLGVRKRTGSLNVGKTVLGTPHSADSNRQRKAPLHQPTYARNISVGVDAKGMSYTPKVFETGPINLEYNRFLMKKPATLNLPPSNPTGDDSGGKQVTFEDSYIPKIAAHTKSWPSFLARNFFNLTNIKLVLTFLINVILLTYQVSTIPDAPNSILLVDNSYIDLLEPTWTPVVLKLASIIHFLLSAVLIVSYCYLKIPLVIFKREKSIAHKLERSQLWVTNKPLETWQEWWDQLVIGAASFPRNYWDKHVKERVFRKFCSDDKSNMAKVLGMEVKSKFEKRTVMEECMETLHSLIDFRYFVWTVGVIVSNPVCQYHMLYCALSFVGLRWNSFYFSIHLLDFAANFKLLRTVLKSVLHNGKQLAMTLMMTAVVIYIYTVIAFNFFRKFYRVQTPEGERVYKCDSMLECFVFHIDQGLRSGGGIADVLEPASGDPNESFRLFFDVTFFFVVVIILLAIIQGLIIDSFGELRDKEETLTNEMLTKCFVCGLPKSEFDHIPHGFDNHIGREHNMAHYMFFLMYLIKKRESEFSGQESYVWEKYVHQSVDFFPVGDCFHSQEERTQAALRAAVEGRSLQAAVGLNSSKHAQQKNTAIKKAQTMPA